MTTATGFNAIVGQHYPVRLLKTLIRNGTLPHALLFTGDDGVGKKSAAMAVAMACNCRALRPMLHQHPPLDAVDACGECAPCRKIAGHNHPDIVHIAPISSIIRIDQIRTLLQSLTLKPNEADRRVIILSDAQAMNPEAGNALLKVLEEPPERTVLILTAHQATDLLPTVVSRCRHIRFSPLGAAAIKTLLMATGEIDGPLAETVADLCGGSYTRALQWADPRWLNRRDWIIMAISRLADHRPPDIRAWLAFSEMLARKKDLVEESLEIIKMWLRDLMVVGVDPERVLNRDRIASLKKAAGQAKPDRWIEQIDAVDQARKAMQFNANVRLSLDAMVLKMAGSHSRKV